MHEERFNTSTNPNQHLDRVSGYCLSYAAVWETDTGHAQAILIAARFFRNRR